MKKSEKININIKNVELFGTEESNWKDEKGIYASDHYGVYAEIEVIE